MLLYSHTIYNYETFEKVSCHIFNDDNLYAASYQGCVLKDNRIRYSYQDSFG